MAKNMAKKKSATIEQVMEDLVAEELNSSLSSSDNMVEEFRSQDSSDSLFQPDHKKTGCKEENLINFESVNQSPATKELRQPSSVQVPLHITLNQSEHLRVAQEKISSLDEEIARLRQENENLADAAGRFEKTAEERLIRYDNLKRDYEENRNLFEDEKKTLRDTLSAQSQEMEKLKIHKKNLEDRLSNNIQQVRVRERELENRLELMNLDGQILSREKDKYILDLKRKLDRIKIDLKIQQSKYSDIQQDLDRLRDQSRKAVRSLSFALNILRGGQLLQDEESTKGS